MSRCFPFPPPGYQRKLRVDDGNLLTKNKDNEKKRKRDKDDEKKERKDKDKDRSKDKHRERSKEKKEKHKHKDKKKELDQSRDGKRFQGEDLVEKASSSSPQSSQLTSSLPGQALGGKNGYVGGATENQSVNSGNLGTFHGTGEILDCMGSIHGAYGCESTPGFDQKVNGQRENGQSKFPKVATVCNLSGVDQELVGASKPVEETIDKTTKEKENNHRSDRNGEKKKGKHKDKVGRISEVQAEKDVRYAQTLGKRIRDDKNGAIGSQIIAKVSTSSQERVELVQKVGNGSATYSLHAKETSKIANNIQKAEKGEREDNKSKNLKVVFVKGMEPVGHKIATPSDMRKIVHIEGARRNVYGGIGVIEGRTTVLEEEKVKQGGDHIMKLPSSKDCYTDSPKQYTVKASSNVSAKRKVPETNGFIHGIEMQPEKLARTVMTSRLPKQGVANSLKMEGHKSNGMTGHHESPLVSTKHPSIPKANGPIDALESLFGSTKPTSPIPIGLIKPPTCTPKANGVMIARESPTSSMKPLFSNVKLINGMISAPKSPMVETNVKAINVNGLPTNPPYTSTKPKKHKEKSSSRPLPPHPDIKYLSHILCIPKTDEWSGFDDQDWLFPSKETKVEVSSFTSEEGDLQVWAKAGHIEAVDIYALPYVIPY